MSYSNRPSTISLVLVLVALTSATPVSSEGLDNARYHLYAANALDQNGDHVNASKHFRAAYGMTGDWTILFDLGLCEKKAGRFGLAQEAFARFIEEGGYNIDPTKKEDAQKQLQSMSTEIGYLSIAGGEVFKVVVDGVSRCPPVTSIPVRARLEHQVTINGNRAQTVVVAPTETFQINLDPEIEE